MWHAVQRPSTASATPMPRRCLRIDSYFRNTAGVTSATIFLRSP